MAADLFDILMRATAALSVSALSVLLLREPVRRFCGARIAYGLWTIVPISTFAAFLPARRLYEAPIATTDAANHPALAATEAALEPVTAPGSLVISSFPLDPPSLLVAIWVAGVAVSLSGFYIGQKRFNASAGRIRPSRDRSHFVAASNAAGPAIIGFIRPRIVMPADFETRYTAEERKLVLVHELMHLTTGDAQTNALAALMQCLQWFNPIAYLARSAFRVDQELACDERVMARNNGSRRAYAEAMLKTQLASIAPPPLGCNWPGLGAQPLKERIALLAKPQAAKARRAIGAALCTAAALSAGVAAWAAQPPEVINGRAVDARELLGFRSGAELVNAILEHDDARARKLIEAGANVDYFLRGDGTPLVVAAQRGDEATARLLLQHGADVNMPAPGDGNPLIVAAMRGDLALAQLFVENGADVNGYVRGDETPLINAARDNRLEVAEYLISKGADVNLEVEAPMIGGLERRSPMSMARRNGRQEMIELLRRRGAT
jgi:beta-lactamase regulating signal transducer with metallopeptidase domain